MRIAVLGLWHLGTVTAASLASVGHSVLGYDEDASVVAGLSAGRLPVSEPGLDDLVRREVSNGRLAFSADLASVGDADVVWVAYDTLVDDRDRADADKVLDQVRNSFAHVKADTLFIVSSQLPVGSTHTLEKDFATARPGVRASFAYSPENLRLGSALDVFLKPDRVVVGVRDSSSRERVQAMLAPITSRIEWMSVESAEMTKHALNSFLATSIAFINEIAGICERVGADAGEVARGLKTDVRIGPRAYLRPGPAFAGATLARDVHFLDAIGKKVGRPTELLTSVARSNETHRAWPLRRLGELMGDLTSVRVAVLGLTYKPGTDTLRRSTTVEICRELAKQGAIVTAYDPALRQVPADIAKFIDLRPSANEAVTGASALIIGNESPQFRELSPEELTSSMTGSLVIDPGGFLENVLGKHPRIRYCKVGRQIET
jgi:UDPglucose 6-dehydrogenase